MKKRVIKPYLFKTVVLMFMMFISSCSTPLDTADPKQSFTKIYNESSFSNAISAIDVVETDEGYLILSNKQVVDQSFPSVSLLSIDKEGKVIMQTELDSINVSPAKGMFKSGANYRFMCMNSNTTEAHIMEVDKQGILVNDVALPNVTYPLCIGLANNGSYLIQGYSQADRATLFANYSNSLTEISNKTYNVLESVENPIFAHLSNTGKRYPFSVGQSASNFYFNGFRSYTFSLVFLRSDMSVDGVLNGFQYDGGISSVVPVEGNTFALSRFYFGENYISPRTTLSPTNDFALSKDIEGRRMLELEKDAAISLSRLTLSGKKVLVYASTTINKQMVLYVYDEATGNLINSKYFGLSIPLEFGSLIATQDGGLLLIGSAYVESRFKRICAIKLAKSQLEDLVK